jgi:hypothetical protein
MTQDGILISTTELTAYGGEDYTIEKFDCEITITVTFFYPNIFRNELEKTPNKIYAA